ncbi:division/cell wall cluster transcriptional repressor MraZ [bacterium]|nr:division/cell wall cluster transcriptional repressor MraZ [bacterium]
MFTGRYQHKLDAKGRIALPAKMREAGKGIAYSEFVVTKGLGGCLAVFPTEKFEEFVNNFDPEDLEVEQTLNFYREFVSWAHFVPVDGQGRINIPAELLEYAGIKKDVLILGIVDWIELWDPERYKQNLEKSKVDYDKGARVFFSSAIRGRRRKNVSSERSGSEGS